MNNIFDQFITRFSLDSLDENPILIKIQIFFRDIAKHYNQDHRFKIRRPSYIFILLIFLAILITIVKLFQSLILILFVVWKSFLTLKISKSQECLTLQLKNWVFLAFLLLFHQCLSKLDLIPPFIQLFLYNFPWFQNSKYTIKLFELLNQKLPERIKTLLYQEQQEKASNQYRIEQEVLKYNRLYLRI
ncbi:unnamed protein product [Paramecium sonneborni]|uniref:Transmembrane protein n=1 Tax=Paramecium sonneborni TaxID=65129 RepID=A0A8S1RN70_9CILI|nr:unnamed protein product [Paramecium sonneborni]